MKERKPSKKRLTGRKRGSGWQYQKLSVLEDRSGISLTRRRRNEKNASVQYIGSTNGPDGNRSNGQGTFPPKRMTSGSLIDRFGKRAH